MPLNDRSNITRNDATGATHAQVALLDDGTCRVMKPLAQRARVPGDGKENSGLRTIRIQNKTYRIMPHSHRPLYFLRYPMDTLPLKSWLAGPEFDPQLEYAHLCDENGALFEIRRVWDTASGQSSYELREVTLDVAALSPTALEDPDEDETVACSVHRVIDWIASFHATSTTTSNSTSTAATASTSSPPSMPGGNIQNAFSFMPIRDDAHTQHRALYRPWPRDLESAAYVSGSVADVEV